MRTNADCTLYSKSVDPATRSEVWARRQVRGVAWEDRKAANVIASGGNLEADSVAVYVPFARGPLTIQPGDVLVSGLVTDEISPSFTISDLKRKYARVVTVRSVDVMDQGRPVMHHWQVGAA